MSTPDANNPLPADFNDWLESIPHRTERQVTPTMDDGAPAKYGTNHPESEALLAVTAGDDEYAKEVLGGMTPDELTRLTTDGHHLAGLAMFVRAGRR